MCGIHASVSLISKGANQNIKSLSRDSFLYRRLCCRGPDHVDTITTRLGPFKFTDDDVEQHVELAFTSTVLSLRGDGVTIQPFVDSHSGSLLCWNGEAWKIGGVEVSGNDGAAVFAILIDASRRQTTESRDGDNVVDALRQIEGPFAFAFFDKLACRLYFSRDRLGRRSLLMHGSDEHNDPGLLSICSVSGSSDSQWSEVEASGIYVMDLKRIGSKEKLARSSLDAASMITSFPWTAAVADSERNVPGIGLFNLSSTVPFEGATLREDSPSVKRLCELLQNSLRLRVLNVPKPPAAKAEEDTRIAVLFSGGLDCTVLARLAHDILPLDQGIDLINAAFENPRVLLHAGGSVADAYEACPDRMTGRKAFAELCRICPSRDWRFIAVNVPYAETLLYRPEVISLMHPHNTEMDLSIAFALFFSARGVGYACRSNDQLQGQAQAEYATPARVLLSGLGADELFGGYGRHGIAFRRQGYKGLADELLLDVSRLGKRNLGRDDRVMSHWGREIRYPYLDEELVRWAIGLPSWEKCDFANPNDRSGGGQSSTESTAVDPEKRVLRLVALQLGMKDVAREKKRAIQFGARTAKMDSGRIKGTATIT